jgi:hypothetical protein
LTFFIVKEEYYFLMNNRKVRKNFGYRLIGTGYMKKMVISTLLLFPLRIVNIISKHCWFISSFEEGWAFVLRGKDIRSNDYVIFLSDELLGSNVAQIRYTIAHEIGHVILGHRNSIGTLQNKKEITKQEKEAHDFVKKYLVS